MKKFELTSEFIVDISGAKLFRIKALIEFGNVKAGELGGYIEKEYNLDHNGNAWVSGDAYVCGDAYVSGNARVFGDAHVCGDALMRDNEDYAYAHGFGSVNRTTTFFRLKDGNVGVLCGCFYGTLQEFRDKVRATRAKSKKSAAVHM